MWWAPQFLKQIFPCELEKVICHQDGASFQSKNPTSPNREPHLLWGSPWPGEERWELQVAVREEASQVSLEGTGEAIAPGSNGVRLFYFTPGYGTDSSRGPRYDRGRYGSL